MNHTKIETVLNPDGTPGYSWNPITGCTFHTADGKCKGGGFPCYAYQLAHGRLKTKYMANTKIATVTAEGWVGVTVTRQAFLQPALDALGSIEATMRYLYFEPLLEHINVTGDELRRGRVGWVIAGGQTRPTKLPDLVDVETIMRAVCHTYANIWLKDSLRPLYPNINQLVKEIPHG